MKTSEKCYFLYPRNSIDGFACAWCAFQTLGDAVYPIELDYDDPLPALEEGSHVYIVGLNFNNDDLVQLSDNHPHVNIFILKNTMADEGERIISAFCLGVWKKFNPSAPIPEMLHMINDYLSYKYDKHESFDVVAALNLYVKYLASWNQYSTMDNLREVQRHGERIRSVSCSVVDSMLENTAKVVISGVETVAVNSAHYTVDICDLLLDHNPDVGVVAVFFWDNSSIRRRWILRSRLRSGFDAGALARAMGGNGNTHEATFLEIENKVEFVK